MLIGVARPPPPPNRNAANDKNVTKKLCFFQFLLASSRTTLHNYTRIQQ